MTALAGLPTYLNLAYVAGLSMSINKHLKVKDGCQGWTDEQTVISLILLNLAGGDSIDDLGILEGDEGFCKVKKSLILRVLIKKVGTTDLF